MTQPLINNDHDRNNDSNTQKFMEKKLLTYSIQQLDSQAEVNRSFIIESSQSSEDQEKVYQMEIAQLKRQNNFLKKKIEELNKIIGQSKSTHPKPNGRKGSKIKMASQSKQNRQSQLEFSIQFFFQEVKRMIESFCSMFHVKLSQASEKQLKSSLMEETTTMEPKHAQQFDLNKKLQKVALEDETKRYPNLLNIFIQYYSIQAQNQQYLKGKVAALSNQVLQISKSLMKSVNQKRMKTSCSIISMKKSSIEYDNNSSFRSLHSFTLCSDNVNQGSYEHTPN